MATLPKGATRATTLAGERPSRSFVVGTAGHVDHGKSTLVKALTGIDPDRLAEEKARQMTIDLGFAHLSLPSGRRVGLVDVPGHERFIKNMLAGVGGIDAALLIVAADEGPMPQTAEHLAILDLLDVRLGVIVLTKRDIVDGDWLDLVREDVRDRLAGTSLAPAPIVAVSAVTGDGLDELTATLDRVLATAPDPPAGGKPRLPIDRVFSITGFGTIVTGTLLGGKLSVGQELRVMPRDIPARVRGLQTYGQKVETAAPGSRVAVNLAGLAVDQLRRGDVLATVDHLASTRRLDARLRLVAEAPIELEQNDQVDLFIGAAETPAWLTLLDRERLRPGETGWVQFRTREPVAVLKGDRFIVRRPSPSLTIGGGVVVDAEPPRHRRFRAEVVGALETLAQGSPDELVLHALGSAPVDLKQLRATPPSGLTSAQVVSALEQLVAEGEARLLGAAAGAAGPGGFVVSTEAWRRLTVTIESAVGAHHAAQPLRRGMPKEELRSRLRLGGPARLFDDVVATAALDGLVVDEGQTVRRPDFAIRLDPVRRRAADLFLSALAAAPYAPPSPAELAVDAETIGALSDLGEVVKVGESVVFLPEALAAIRRDVLMLIDRDGSITLAGFRDHFQTSRKYAQAILEFLDQNRVTRRVGDERVRFAGPIATHASKGGDE